MIEENLIMSEDKNAELERRLEEVKESLGNNESNIGYEHAKELIKELEIMREELMEAITILNNNKKEYRDIIDELKVIKEELLKSKENETVKRLLSGK